MDDDRESIKTHNPKIWAVLWMRVLDMQHGAGHACEGFCTILDGLCLFSAFILIIFDKRLLCFTTSITASKEDLCSEQQQDDNSMWEAWEGAYISYTRNPIRRRKRQGQEEWHFGILNRRFQSKTAFSVGKDQTPCTLCTHAPVIFRNRHLNLVSPIWLSPWCHVGQLCLRSASLVSW